MELPDRQTIVKLLSQYVPVQLEVDTSGLENGDRLALAKLIRPASWTNQIFWKQHSAEGWNRRESLSGVPGKPARDLERLMDLNFGPWDIFNSARPFWGTRLRPPGGNLYPPDLSREEFQAYAARHPQERPALSSHTTVVRRDGDRLVAIPYHEVYREELTPLAAGLAEAAEMASNDHFRKFLRARAREVLTGSLKDSEGLWIGAADSPIDIAIGPYETYDDGLLGLKTSYEASVLVRHPMTEQLGRFQDFAPEFERQFPGAASAGQTGSKLAIGVYDVVYTAGMANMGAKAIAAMLPGEQSVRSEYGARLLLFRNVIAAKFRSILGPFADRLTHSDLLKLFREEAAFYHALLHEMVHALGSGLVSSDGRQSGQRIDEALGERFATIEESRADLLGLLFLELLSNRGLLPSDLVTAAAVTYVIASVQALRFGAADDYARAAAITLTDLIHRGAIKIDRDGDLSIEVEGVLRGVRALAETVQDIATTGNYRAAGELIEDCASVPPEIQRLMPRFEGMPVDLAFLFDSSAGFA